MRNWTARMRRSATRIREAQLQKVPYMLVVGEKEAASGQIAVRSRKGEPGRLGPGEFLAKLKEEAQSKK